jgi:hypothetical protein
MEDLVISKWRQTRRSDVRPAGWLVNAAEIWSR